MKIESFKDLKVWQLGMELSERVYNMTKTFPDEEKFGLTSQMRRAVVSVPANIAEGHARNSTKEYMRFLSIAVGSLAEVETFVELSIRLSYVTAERTSQLLESIAEQRRMLRGLQRSLSDKNNESLTPDP
ncbi:four helix bundle protein [Aeoliella sp. ICT_H6.2]|uniref:Four helix bundle protein n=1 Tax=Aeoliella straminimaris TaxID=2954799 RepID=A0A9X2JGL5_9BACT|nr:four helix bundle protein [Aeoliella straminimaris]